VDNSSSFTKLQTMTNLSPAAQAVLDAAMASAIKNLHGTYERDIAAALRAVSEHGEFVILDDSGYGDFVVKVDFLRAIADELERQ
jgi:hypothetical protein